MVVKSLKIKNVSYYFWNDIIYLNPIRPRLFGPPQAWGDIFIPPA